MSTRVLVVDDDPDVCELVGKTLTRVGHRVVTAHSGEAALELLEQGLDCLVVDKLLPGMHGAELMAEARRRFPSLPVVLISGHPEPFSFGDERPDVILAKPFKSLQAIEEAVTQALTGVSDPSPVESAVETIKERLTQVVELTPLRRKRE